MASTNIVCSLLEHAASCVLWYIKVTSAQREIRSCRMSAKTALSSNSAMRTWKLPKSSVRTLGSVCETAARSFAMWARSILIFCGVAVRANCTAMLHSNMRLTENTCLASSTDGLATNAPRAGSIRTSRF